MPESPYAKWVREEREAWKAHRDREGPPATEGSFRQWLELKSFSLIEQAITLLEASIDASGESSEAHSEAVDRVIADANRLRIPFVYMLAEYDEDGYGLHNIEARLAQLRAMRYSDYLASPEWQLQRRSALRRANGRCEACNKAARLHVHHRSYERLGEEDADDLVVLCADCHGAVHWHGGAHRPAQR